MELIYNGLCVTGHGQTSLHSRVVVSNKPFGRRSSRHTYTDMDVQIMYENCVRRETERSSGGGFQWLETAEPLELTSASSTWSVLGTESITEGQSLAATQAAICVSGNRPVIVSFNDKRGLWASRIHVRVRALYSKKHSYAQVHVSRAGCCFIIQLE